MVTGDTSAFLNFQEVLLGLQRDSSTGKRNLMLTFTLEERGFTLKVLTSRLARSSPRYLEMAASYSTQALPTTMSRVTTRSQNCSRTVTATLSRCLAPGINGYLAARFSDYDSIGQTTTWRSTLVYAPVNDFAVRLLTQKRSVRPTSPSSMAR